MSESPEPKRPSSGKQARADRTRQAMLDATVDYILHQGFTAPSVRRITERAGLTWGVVQYHFGDLDGLLIAVVEQGLAQLTEAIDGLPDLSASTQSNQWRVETIVEAMWPAFSSATSRAAMEILIATRATRSHTINAHLSTVDRQVRSLGALLGQGLSPSHAEDIGNLIWVLLRGLVVAQMVSPVQLDTTHERTSFVHVLTTFLDSMQRPVE